MAVYWTQRDKHASHSSTVNEPVTLSWSLIGLWDKPLPPVAMNSSLCFRLHSPSARRPRNVWCHIVRLVFSPTNRRLWSFFSPHSAPGHKMLQQQSSEAELCAVSLVRTRRGWWVSHCTMEKKMSRQIFLSLWQNILPSVSLLYFTNWDISNVASCQCDWRYQWLPNNRGGTVKAD